MIWMFSCSSWKIMLRFGRYFLFTARWNNWFQNISSIHFFALIGCVFISNIHPSNLTNSTLIGNIACWASCWCLGKKIKLKANMNKALPETNCFVILLILYCFAHDKLIYALILVHVPDAYPFYVSLRSSLINFLCTAVTCPSTPQPQQCLGVKQQVQAMLISRFDQQCRPR